MIQIPDTIFPKDADGNKICPKCKNVIDKCTCPSYDPSKPKDVSAIIKIDKSGRKGKVVTLIEGLPKDKEYLKKLTKRLKVKCGSGGTYILREDYGIIEIQGEKVGIIKGILINEGIILKSK